MLAAAHGLGAAGGAGRCLTSPLGRVIALPQLDDTVRRTVPEGADSAIYLGELATLARRNVEFVGERTTRTYDPVRLRHRLPLEEIVFLQSGGNFGDLARAPGTSKRAMRDFRRHPVVVLPVTINFEHERAADRTRPAHEPHGNVAILVLQPRPAQRRRPVGLGTAAVHLT
jgi:hypothetical protein